MMLRWASIVLGLVAIAGTAAACEGLSPGDELNVGNFICTLGFLVADPNGLYFTTAGHCIHVDETASTPDVGDWGVGVFHYLEPETGSETDGSPGHDFALIRVDPDAYGSLNPKMCGYDGPNGLYNETPGSGGVQTYGHGLVFGDAGDIFGAPTNARPGVGLQSDGDAFYWFGMNTPGDSGGAVLSDDGRAIGVLTHLTAGTAGTNGGTTLERGFRLAADAGFTQLRLVLAGEDPVKVLSELRNGPTPVPPTTASPGSGAKPTPPGSNSTGPSSSNGTAPAAANGTTSGAVPPARDDDSIAPAATNGEDEAKKVPMPALLSIASVAVALFVRRRLS
ncbi:MAG TPA: hypothetical protein VM370_07120 [Candidatus Thermoplasmatota archaeon]|nr:hypothetical protein [Candidatus Thermoplasmatota archaeon]